MYAPGKRREYLAHRKDKTQARAAKAAGIAKSTASRWDVEERRRGEGKSARDQSSKLASAFVHALAKPGSQVASKIVGDKLRLPLRLAVSGRVLLDVTTREELAAVKGIIALAEVASEEVAP